MLLDTEVVAVVVLHIGPRSIIPLEAQSSFFERLILISLLLGEALCVPQLRSPILLIAGQ